MSEVVAVRIEANFTTGMGHLARNLALTKSLPKEKYDIYYFISNKSSAVKEIIENNSIKVITLPYYEDENIEADWIRNYCSDVNLKIKYFLVDHYKLGEEWERRVARFSERIVVLDDLANRKHDSNYLIDTGFGRTIRDYSGLVTKKTKLLLNNQYFILRPEFYLKRKSSYEHRLNTKIINSLLISFGATDPHNDSFKLLDIIEKIDFKGNVNILTTSLNENLGDLIERSKGNKKIVMHVDSQSVSDVILKSDLAVGALGGGAIERIILGLPSICLMTEKNQEFNAKQLSDINAIKLAQPSNVEKVLKSCLRKSFMDEWHQISKSCFSLYDGLGVYRILKAIFNETQDIELIEMTERHCLDLFNWQIEPGNRKFSRSEIAPEWDEHVNWFNGSLKDERRRMWVIQIHGMNCGYIRLDDIENQEEVSILISQKFRRLGVAGVALQAIKEKSKYSNVLATVHRENTASIELFIGAGFIKKTNNTYVWVGK